MIASKAYVAAGRLTPDGRFIVLTDVPDEFRTRVTIHDSGAVVEATKVLADSGAAIGGSVQSGQLLRTGAAEVLTPAEEQEQVKQERGPAKTGLLDLRMSNDNMAFAFQPGRKYFDIVFLPDFEEEYVITTKARLGNALADITLGQGWSLQGMAMKVDNQELNKRIFALMDEAQQLLTAAARTAVGIPPIVGGPQAGELATADRVFKGGTPVSVKVTLVRLVAPGLYKILKPKELEKLGGASTVSVDQDDKNRILLPVDPLTDIAFNTYEVIVCEAVPVTGDSPLRMHQTVDVSLGGARGGGTLPKQPVDLTALKDQVDAWLASRFSDLKVTADLTLSPDGSTIRVSLLPEAGTSLSDEQKTEIMAGIRESLKGTGLNVMAKE